MTTYHENQLALLPCKLLLLIAPSASVLWRLNRTSGALMRMSTLVSHIRNALSIAVAHKSTNVPAAGYDITIAEDVHKHTELMTVSKAGALANPLEVNLSEDALRLLSMAVLLPLLARSDAVELQILTPLLPAFGDSEEKTIHWNASARRVIKDIGSKMLECRM